MAKTDLAHFVFSPYVGGAEAVMKQILEHLKDFSENCLVLTSDEIKGYFSELDMPVFSIGSFNFFSKTMDPFPSLPIVNRWMRKAYLNFLVPRLRSALQKHGVQVLHTHLLFDHYLASRLFLKDLRWVATMHGSYRLDMDGPRYATARDIRTMYRKPVVVTSACQYFFHLLKEIGVDLNKRQELIPNGINLAFLERKRRTGIKDGTLKMVFLGGDRHEKGGDLLVEALHHVVRKMGHENIRLDILRKVGPDSRIAQLTRDLGLDDKVKFRGYVGNGAHIEFLSKSDLFVLPSRTEGIANTLLEAIGLSKPILATDVGGTGEVVRHGENGYLCKPTVESLAEGVVFFIDNPEKLDVYGEKNGELKSKYLWENVVPLYEKLYDRILNPER